MLPFLQSIAPGTLPQWGTLLAVIAAIVIVALRTSPARVLAKAEAKALENSDAETLRAEMVALNQRARDDIHALRNQLAAVDAKQIKCTKALADAHAENRIYRDDMQTLLFLIRLLISEVKRLDDDPKNIIIQQAEMVLGELERKRADTGNGVKALEALADDAVEKAGDAVEKAEASLDAAVVTKNEIKGEGEK